MWIKQNETIQRVWRWTQEKEFNNQSHARRNFSSVEENQIARAPAGEAVKKPHGDKAS